jgi:hypothetical protein
MLAISFAQAQQKAITERGEQVILHADNTWEYLPGEEFMETEIPTNPKKFEKDEASSFLIKSSNFNIGFWINPKTWSFIKSTDLQSAAEYEFELKGEDLYGLAITEKIEIPLTTLKQLAIENARSIAPDMKVVKEEYRNVNGLEVLLLLMHGNMQGIKFAYYGYYYSNENGTVQFITFTSQNLMEKLIEESESLLNGLVLLD